MQLSRELDWVIKAQLIDNHERTALLAGPQGVAARLQYHDIRPTRASTIS